MNIHLFVHHWNLFFNALKIAWNLSSHQCFSTHLITCLVENVNKRELNVSQGKKMAFYAWKTDFKPVNPIVNFLWWWLSWYIGYSIWTGTCFIFTEYRISVLCNVSRDDHIELASMRTQALYQGIAYYLQKSTIILECFSLTWTYSTRRISFVFIFFHIFWIICW